MTVSSPHDLPEASEAFETSSKASDDAFVLTDDERVMLLQIRANKASKIEKELRRERDKETRRALETARQNMKDFITIIKTISPDDVDAMLIRDIDNLSREDLLKVLKVTRSRMAKDARIIMDYDDIDTEFSIDELPFEIPDFYDDWSENTYRSLSMKISSAETAHDLAHELLYRDDVK